MINRKKIAYQTKRVWFDLAILIIIGAIFFIAIPDTMGGLQMFLFKALLVSAGVMHAHIVRKLLFPYIDFNKTRDQMQKLMVVVIYAVIIFAWSRGG